MCRFTLYLGEDLRLSALLTEPVNSIVNQSYDAEEMSIPMNGDGFGVAWYAPARRARPAAYRALTPAWSNRNLADLAEVIESPCVLAHVRAASPGLPVAEANCHPFVAGELAFMHNGGLAGFPAIRKQMIEAMSDEAFATVLGTTDSEHLFGLFQDHYRARDDAGAARLAGALEATLAQVLPMARAAAPGVHSTLNLAVSDGSHAAVCRMIDGPEEDDARTLYLHTGRRVTVEGGETRLVDCGEDEGGTLVSSEPLSLDAGWEAVPGNHLVLVEGPGRAAVRPVSLA